MELTADVLGLPDNHTFNGSDEDGLLAFLSIYHRLLRIANRMLKDVSGAEDVVQDVWLRWQTTNRKQVLDPPSFLRTTTTRICLNVLQSARVRREMYVESWLIEPTDPKIDPQNQAEQREAIEASLQVLSESLRPIERAAYVLRESFDYSYRQLAVAFHLNEASVRKIVARARIKVSMSKPSARPLNKDPFVEAYLFANESGDLSSLEEFLIVDASTATGEHAA